MNLNWQWSDKMGECIYDNGTKSQAYPEDLTSREKNIPLDTTRNNKYNNKTTTNKGGTTMQWEVVKIEEKNTITVYDRTIRIPKKIAEDLEEWATFYTDKDNKAVMIKFTKEPLKVSVKLHKSKGGYRITNREIIEKLELSGKYDVKKEENAIIFNL